MFKIGEEAPFKKDERVKFTESSLASGMIDAKEGDVFTVKESYKRAVTLKELEGCYHVTHFEHVKEEIMDNTEEQEIKWEIGQEVWCLIFGKGVVIGVGSADTNYSIVVDFGNDTVPYTVDGRYYFDHNRTLFFSEPKIEAEKFPSKKPFTPKLKEGDSVVVKHKRLEDKAILTVEQEDEDVVWFKEEGDGYFKTAWNFFKIGEEVEFK